MNKKLVTLLALFLSILQSMAQTPDMYPPPEPEPVDFSLFNIILYIVLPVILIVAYFLYRKSVKKKKMDKK
ncbi:MAG TPA: hypothetical protein VKA10_03725 [Prolixibacteraceae bacterium]|nr:hypothetical protein [Prolixibacteraceae bacterium]